MDRNKQILLVALGCYILGFVGIFISTMMEIWNLGPTMYVFGEAAWRAAIWPYEIFRLLTEA